MVQAVCKENLWLLSFPQLIKRCQSIAEDLSPEVDPGMRAEAGRLLACWHETFDKPAKDFDAQTHQATQLAGLRQRTIEILVRAGYGL
jgi:hypothetical protein